MDCFYCGKKNIKKFKSYNRFIYCPTCYRTIKNELNKPSREIDPELQKTLDSISKSDVTKMFGGHKNA